MSDQRSSIWDSDRRYWAVGIIFVVAVVAVAAASLIDASPSPSEGADAADPAGNLSRVVNAVAVIRGTVSGIDDAATKEPGVDNPVVELRVSELIWQPEGSVFGEPPIEVAGSIRSHTLSFEEYEIGREYFVFLGWHPYSPGGVSFVTQYALNSDGRTPAFGDDPVGAEALSRLTTKSVELGLVDDSDETPEVAALIALIVEEQSRFTSKDAAALGPPGLLSRAASGLPDSVEPTRDLGAEWTAAAAETRFLPTEMDKLGESIQDAVGSQFIFYEAVVVDDSAFDPSVTHFGLELKGVGLLGKSTRDRDQGTVLILGFGPPDADVRFTTWGSEDLASGFESRSEFIRLDRSLASDLVADGRTFVVDLRGKAPDIRELSRVDYDDFVVSLASDTDVGTSSELED
jgi:hypothetical protein